MFPVPGIPLRGQGNRLPRDCPYDGEWLLDEISFLYRSTPTLPAADSQLTAGFRRADGEWCVGFDSSVLANGLNVTVDELFAANRARSLKLATVEDVAPARGGAAAKRYVFALSNCSGTCRRV
jgi:hypothetical protein